jgi:hypothetical protein
MELKGHSLTRADVVDVHDNVDALVGSTYPF